MARGQKNQVPRRKPIDLTGIFSDMDKDQLVALVGTVTDKMATQLCASFSPPVGAVTPTGAASKDESQPQNVESTWSQPPAGRSNKNNDPGAKENIMPSSGPAMVAKPTNSRSQPRPGPAVGQGGNRGEATEQMTSPLGVLKRESLEIFTKWQATVMARVGDIFTKPPGFEPGPALRGGGGGRGRGAGSMRGDGGGRGRGGGRGGRGVSGPQDPTRGGHWGNGRGGAQPGQALAVSHAGIGPCRPPPLSQVDPALRIRFPPTGTSLWQRPIDKRRLILHVMTLLLMSLEEYTAYSRILLLNLTSSLLLPLQALHDEEVKMAQAIDRALGVLPLPPDDPTPANPNAKPEQQKKPEHNNPEHKRGENTNGQIDNKQNGPEGEKKAETSAGKPVDMLIEQLAEQLAEKLAMSKKNPDEQNKNKTPDEQKDQTPAEPKEAGIPDEHKTPLLPHGQNDSDEQKPAAVHDPAGRGNKAGRESKCINPRKVKAGNAAANAAAMINTLLGPLMAAGLGTVPGEARLTKPMVTNLLGTTIESAPALGAFFGMLGGIGPNGPKPISKSMEQFGKDVQDFALVPLGPEIRQITSSYTSARLVPAEHRRMRFVIAIGGWIADEGDLISPWRCLGRQAEAFCVKWELASLMNLGNALHVIMQSSAWGLVKRDIIARTTIASLAQGHWPLSLLQISKLIENPWNVAMVRADKTGLILAETIIRRIPGGRPVSLVGYSLGARSIYTCLMALAERRHLGLIDSVVLIGTPAPAESRVWLTMKSAVAGRLVNVYCESDYLLAFVYRAFNIEFGLAGIQPVLDVDGVENHNVGNLPSGHVRYHHMVGPILRDIGWEDLDLDQTVRDMELLAQADARFEAETQRRQANAKLIVAADGTVTVDIGKEIEEIEKEVVHKNNTASASNSNANSGGRKKKKRGQGNGKFKIPN